MGLKFLRELIYRYSGLLARKNIACHRVLVNYFLLFILLIIHNTILNKS